MEKERTKVKDLSPQSKQVNVLAKVVSVGDQKEIPSRFGPPRRVAEAVIGDETGTVILSLWQDQIGSVVKDDVIYVDNGYVSLVKGHIHLNVGKYGKLSKSEENIAEVDTTLNVSEKEYPQERPAYRYGGGYGGSRSFEDRGERRGRDRERRRF